MQILQSHDFRYFQLQQEILQHQVEPFQIKTRSFDTLAIHKIRNLETVNTNTQRRIYGIRFDAIGRIELVADTNQYIDFTTINNDYERRTTFSSTNT